MSERNGGAFDAPVYKREQRKASRAVHQEDVRAENERLRAALKEITGACHDECYMFLRFPLERSIDGRRERKRQQYDSSPEPVKDTRGAS